MRAKYLLVFAVGALMVAAPYLALGNDGEGNGPPAGLGHGNACSLDGTWVGGNSLELEYLMSVTWVGGKHYKSVAEGVNDLTNFGCLDGTAFRGDAKRTGRLTYEVAWLGFCDTGGPEPIIWGSMANFSPGSIDVLTTGVLCPAVE